MSYTEAYAVRTRDCDMFGRWKPSAVLEAMQEVAISHCDSAGLGRGVTDGLGVAWVLSRCRVEFSRLPACGERVSIETYALPMKHLFFPRAHVFTDGSGQVIGGAHGLWLLMDMQTRRIVKDPFVTEHLPIEPREAPTRQPATVMPPAGSAAEAVIHPLFTEFDLNGHVNNARYLDWCWNALGADSLRDHALAGFDVNYDSEVLPGIGILAGLWREGDTFAFCGYDGKRRCFGIRGELRKV